MDVRDFLNRSNTKRDLSSSSKGDDELKGQREKSLNLSCLNSEASKINFFARIFKIR